MATSPLRNQRPTSRFRLVAGLAALVVLAAACSGSDSIPAAEAIETNDGGVLVKPPDVLEGDPVPTTAPVPDAHEAGDEAVASGELPAPVEGLTSTPVVEFSYFDGSTGSTADFAGRPTVLNFWASNCAACVAEMPEFEQAHQALLGTVDFVGMNVADVSREAAVELAAQTGVTYALADDTTSAVFREFRGFVMPTTVLLNPQGQVAFTWSGVLTGDELLKLIDEHIAPGSNPDA